MQCLPHTRNQGITYRGHGCGLSLEAYTDSKTGAFLDTRHLVSGAVVVLSNGEIGWQSRLQEVLASVTSEVEYGALSEVAKYVLLLR